METAKADNTQVSRCAISRPWRPSMVTSEAPPVTIQLGLTGRAADLAGCVSAAVERSPRRCGVGPSLGAVLPTVHSDQVPPQPLLTLEGGRPRSRAEKKIMRQRRFSFRTAPLTSDPDSPSCDHSVSSGTRSEGEPSGGPHREKEKRNAQHLSRWIERKLAERLGDPCHECELCGDIDDATTHAPLSTGEVVCWHCAERGRGVRGALREGVADRQRPLIRRSREAGS